MPVRARSTDSRLAIQLLASRVARWMPSSSAEKPGRMIPEFASVAGGSSVMAVARRAAMSDVESSCDCVLRIAYSVLPVVAYCSAAVPDS